MAIRKGVKASREKRKNIGGNKYLKLNDGDVFLVAFLGVLMKGEEEEPLAVEVVWKEGRQGRYSELYDETKHNESDIKTSFVWQVAAIDISDLHEDDDIDFDSAEVKILQGGPSIFDLFIKQRDGRKGLGHWFELSRVGSGQYDTKYGLERDEKLEEEDMDRLKSMELLDLEAEITKDERDGDGDDAPEEPKRARRGRRRRRSEEAPKTVNKREASDLRLVEGADDPTITPEQMGKLKSVLKSFEGEEMTKAQVALASKFGIKKLNQLQSDDFDSAIDFLEEMKAPKPAAAVGDGLVDEDDEDDPFM